MHMLHNIFSREVNPAFTSNMNAILKIKCSIQVLPKNKKRNMYGVLYPITSYFLILKEATGEQLPNIPEYLNNLYYLYFHYIT